MFDSRKFFHTVLLILVSAASISTYAQTTTAIQSNGATAIAVDTQQAVYLAGLGDVKPGTRGTLRLTSGELYFENTLRAQLQTIHNSKRKIKKTLRGLLSRS